MMHTVFQASFRPLAETNVRWTGLHGSSTALALAQAAREHEGVLLVLARSSHRARMLMADLALFDAGQVVLFPDRETLPYDPYSAHPDIIAERLHALVQIASMERGLVVAPAASLLERLPPRSHVLGQNFDLATGQRLDIEAFRQQLLQAGYDAVEQVYQAGQVAVRGSVVDLFPTGLAQPVRLDLFDDEIESIRRFDPDSQRSGENLAAFRMLPAREYPVDPGALEAFRRAFRYRFAVDMRKVPLYQDLRQGAHPQGLEQYLPLFYEDTETLLNYLPRLDGVVLLDGALAAMPAFEAQTADRWEQRRHDPERPVLDPSELFLPASEAVTALDALPRLEIMPETEAGPGVEAFDAATAPPLALGQRGEAGRPRLEQWLDDWPGRVLFAADTTGRRELIQDTLRTLDLRPERFDSWQAFMASGARTGLLVLPLEEGFLIGDRLAVLTETQLFGGRARVTVARRESERDPEAIIRNLSDLDQGAPVVHEDHGVGRYQGLQTLEIDGRPAEFLMLEYAQGDKLYVPVSSLHLVSRYTGSSTESAPLHRLGGEQWSRIRRKAAQKVRDVAAELLDLYARRQARQGLAYTIDERLYNEFAASFPFEETADQQQAIEAVLNDMRSPLPMDRVVCGDVGFGKTEVALRAAFVAVQGGRQVALLAPTTLLAQQHFSTFTDRLADWPVRVESLSRFRTGKEANETLKALADGRVDIVIGTHRLIQRDIRFDRLGLVIVDEEQRFGVRQKEQLKQLRAEVDMLTLTATPIPRTLNMALSGIRDLSIIATPPARRMAVKTLVVEWERALLREALQREIQRGGQVYFLHNEVRSIDRIAREVQELVPDARIRVAHGQMHERELEQVMLDFYRQRFHVLVCTTIIENGIDNPTANTIVVNRADRFGLSQLHQLRGRVGRSHHLAYAYLVVPERRAMTRDALKRLEAIAALQELGAGFTLATHDMEIRGAGEFLGDEQSGQIQQIGFSLYSELLNRAVEALKAGEEADLEGPMNAGVDVQLHLAALIPEDFIPDVHTRLTLYKRIASARNEAALRDLQVELIDRFGLLPDPARNLFAIARLRLLAEPIGVERLDLGPRGGRIEFGPDASADAEAMLAMIHRQPRDFRLAGPERLQILRGEDNDAQRIEQAETVLRALTPAVPA